MKLRWSSFAVAFRGLAWMLRTQVHARWHLLASITVIVLGLVMNVTRGEWLALLLAMALVWTAEALNTALEQACDAVTKEQSEPIRRAKDAAAGAVLIASIFAATVGAVVFLR